MADKQGGHQYSLRVRTCCAYCRKSAWVENPELCPKCKTTFHPSCVARMGRNSICGNVECGSLSSSSAIMTNLITLSKNDLDALLSAHFAKVNDSVKTSHDEQRALHSSLDNLSVAVAARFKETDDTIAKLEAKSSLMENRIDNLRGEHEALRNVVTALKEQVARSQGGGSHDDCQTALEIVDPLEHPTAKSEYINLKIVESIGTEMWLKMKKSWPMSKLKEAFCKRKKESIDSMRFFFDEGLIQSWVTPTYLQMVNGDTIHVYQRLIAGGRMNESNPLLPFS